MFYLQVVRLEEEGSAFVHERDCVCHMLLDVGKIYHALVDAGCNLFLVTTKQMIFRTIYCSYE